MTQAHTQLRPKSSPVAAGPQPVYQPTPRYMSSLRREHGFGELKVEGTLPAGLKGSLVRNGPGLYETAGKRYSHLFEGDGALSAVRFVDGRALGAHRVVQTEGLLKERKAQKPLYGSLASWPRRFLNSFSGPAKNAANTNIMVWQERLFALFEAGKPTEVDPNTLDTLGERDFQGTISESFSAHHHPVASLDTIFNFGQIYGKDPALKLFALPASGGARRLARLPLAANVMLHDFIATERHLVFFVSPVKLKVWRALLAVGDFSELFHWDEKAGTEIIVVPLDRPEAAVRFETDSFYQWHFANAYEDEIVVDYLNYMSFDSFFDLEAGDVPVHGSYSRARVNPGKRRWRREELSKTPAEFSRVKPNQCGACHDHVWWLNESLSDRALVGLNLQSGKEDAFSLGPYERASEPVFVPDVESSGPGWVLSLIYDERRYASYVGVFQAYDLAAGPVARCHFDHHVPVTFHGDWVSA